ncbi:uncharacterized protein B0T15DRAFT_534465, partial [Chaetomium strumarium]
MIPICLCMFSFFGLSHGLHNSRGLVTVSQCQAWSYGLRSFSGGMHSHHRVSLAWAIVFLESPAFKHLFLHLGILGTVFQGIPSRVFMVAFSPGRLINWVGRLQLWGRRLIFAWDGSLLRMVSGVLGLCSRGLIIEFRKFNNIRSLYAVVIPSWITCSCVV